MKQPQTSRGAVPSPHSYTDCEQSPRLSAGTRTAPHRSAKGRAEAGLSPQYSAPLRTNERGSSRKTVANGVGVESQKVRAWLAAFVLCLAFWALFFGSLFAAGAFGRCRTHRCFDRVHDKHVAHWLKEQRPWIYAWRHLSGWERTWARCIANHETRGIAWSRKRYVATGNGYYGGVQFLPTTWHNAGGSGLPTDHTLHEQLVRAVRWAHVAGASQWSTSRYCGSV